MVETPKDIVLRYLHDHNTVTISTYGEDGPWATALFYVNDGFKLYFLSNPTSIHCKNIVEYPHVAATINEDYHDWREIKGVQLNGTAELVTSRREKASAFALYVKKFPFVAEFFSSPAQITRAMFSKVSSTTWYKVVPQRVFFVDNKQGFGHREEVVIED